MPEGTEHLWYARAAMRWLLIVPVAAVVAVSLLAGLLVQASAPADAPLPEEPRMAEVSTGVVTDTRVFLPIVSAVQRPSVAITVPAEPGTIGLPQRIVAEAATPGATGPLTFTWQATGLEPVVHVGGPTDSVDLIWELTGNKVITVIVSNGQSSAWASAPFNLTTRGMIVFERKTTETYQHDLVLTHHEHTDVVFNLTNTPDLDEGAPAWSPDGNWIVYAAGALSGGNRTLYKIDLTTRQVYTVTDGTTDDRWPAWSPDGTRIAFMRNQAGLPVGKFIPDIFVTDVDGSNQQQLTDWLYGDEYPAWSDDGQSIAFISNRDYAGRDIYLMNPDGSNQRRVLLTPNQDEVYPTWSLDGLIYYTFYVDRPQKEWLYRVNPETATYSKVFDDNYNRYIASFSPDGQCFSFYSPLGDVAGPDKEVWKWCDGYTSPVNLTDNDVADEYSAWSPVP